MKASTRVQACAPHTGSCCRAAEFRSCPDVFFCSYVGNRTLHDALYVQRSRIDRLSPPSPPNGSIFRMPPRHWRGFSLAVSQSRRKSSVPISSFHQPNPQAIASEMRALKEFPVEMKRDAKVLDIYPPHPEEGASTCASEKRNRR